MMKFIMPTFLFNIEKWKWNSEYRVFVSNMGHFKDEYKKDIPTKIDCGGYCKIRTYLGYKAAHRLVLLTWKPIADAETLTVDHLDHNKRNNTVSNLEWVTYEENQIRAAKDQLKGKEAAVEAPAVNIHINTMNVTVRNTPKGLSRGDKDRQLNKEENYLKPLSDGINVYKDAYEAAKIYIAKRKMQNVTSKKIARRIVAAIFFNKKYLDTKWYFVEEA